MPGNFSHVIRAYLASPQFAGLADSTRQNWRRELELAEQQLGPLAVGIVRPAIVQAFLDGLADHPGKQSVAKTALRRLGAWAVVRDLLPHSITEGVEIIGSDDGYEPWTEDNVATAISWCRGDLSRVISIAVNTGQRGSDIIRMRWADIAEGEGRKSIAITQKKTGLRLRIPLSQAFAAELQTWEKISPFIVNDKFGRPYRNRKELSKAWYWELRKNPALAELRGLVLHGLRPTAVVRLRGAGATELEISSMVGMSAQMVTRYCRFADRNDLATRAMDRIDNIKVLPIKSLKSQ